MNPMLLSEMVSPRLGQAWVSNIDLTGQPTATQTLLWVSLADLATPISKPYGEILIDPLQSIGPPFAGTGLYVVPIPSDPSLDGLVLHAQGAIRPGRIVLTNAMVTTVTF